MNYDLRVGGLVQRVTSRGVVDSLATACPTLRSFGSILILLITAGALAQDTPKPRLEQTNDFRIVQKSAAELAKKHHPENVLLVFDIDNTLLAMSDDLGSVQWFRWQEELLAKAPASEHLVGKDFNGLLRVQGIIFAIGRMRLTQPELPQIAAEMQKQGHSTVLLSSRGFEFRDATRQALLDNKFDFASSGLSPAEGYPSPYEPYSLENPAAAGFTAEEATAWKLKKARKVSYAEGVYLTAGQHKGAMLRALLKRSDSKPKAIVFVDDQPKHHVEMEQAFFNQPIELVCYRLTTEDAWADGFANDQARQQLTTSQWKKLQQALPGTEPVKVGK